MTKVLTIISMNVLTEFYANPSNSGRDISLTTTNLNLMVALEEKSEAQKIIRTNLMKTRILYQFIK